jgi:hypothetical protein
MRGFRRLVLAIAAVSACSDPVKPWPLPQPVPWDTIDVQVGTQIERDVHEIVVDPRDAAVIYVVSGNGLFASDNGGTTWRRIYTSTTAAIGKVALDPANPDRVYFASFRMLLVSPDRGASWDTLNVLPENEGIRAIEISRFAPGTIYVGAQGPGNYGIWRSIDAGLSWESHAYPTLLTGTSQFLPWDIAEDPQDGTLYVANEIHDHQSRHPAFRSVDGGLSWENVSEALPWHGVRIIVEPNHDVVYLTEGAGVWRSKDHGISWRQVGNGTFALDLVRDANTPSRYFGGEVFYLPYDRSGGVYVSTDSLVTFVRHGLDGLTCGSLAISADSRRLYAACWSGGTFVLELAP